MVGSFFPPILPIGHAQKHHCWMSSLYSSWGSRCRSTDPWWNLRFFSCLGVESASRPCRRSSKLFLSSGKLRTEPSGMESIPQETPRRTKIGWQRNLPKSQTEIRSVGLSRPQIEKWLHGSAYRGSTERGPRSEAEEAGEAPSSLTIEVLMAFETG